MNLAMKMLRLVVGAVVIGGLAPSFVRAADDTNIAQLFVDPSFSGGTGADDQTVSQPGSIALNGFATGGSNSTGDGSVQVNYGVVKLGGEFFGSGDTQARGFYNDVITPHSPSVPNGTPGTFKFSISVSGTLNPIVGGSSAGYLLNGNIGGGASQINVSGTAIRSESTGLSFSGTPLGTFTGTVSFTYGQSLPLQVELQGGASVGYSIFDLENNVIPQAAFDLAHSSYWEGITDMTANGLPVSSFTVDSLSGVDWSQSFAPVPEPVGVASMAMGLLFLSRRRR